MTISLTIKSGVARQYPTDSNEDWGVDATNWAIDVTTAINNSPVNAEILKFDVIVGSAADLAAGNATHTTLVAGIAACPAGGMILVLDGTYSQAAALDINKAVPIVGQGAGTIIDSTAAIAAGEIVKISSSGVSLFNCLIDDGAGTPEYALLISAGVTETNVSLKLSGTFSVSNISNLSDSISITGDDGIFVGPSGDVKIQVKNNDTTALSIGSEGDPDMMVLDTTIGDTKVLFNTTLAGANVLDEDTMISDSDVAVPTQQSVKAYVDTATAAQNEFIELTDTPAAYAVGDAAKLVRVNATETGLEFSAESAIDHNGLTNTHDLTTDIDHNSITNTHDLTTDIDHNSITNTHDLTTDIDHNSINNTHDLTTDIDHNSITNTHQGVDTTDSPTFINPSATGELRLVESAAGTDNYTGFKAPADLGAANCIYTMPAADGAASSVLTTDGSKTLSWAAAASAALNSRFVDIGNTANVRSAVDTTKLGTIDASYKTATVTFDETGGAVENMCALAGHGFTLNQPVYFSGADLPNLVIAGTVYYVIPTHADYFQLMASPGTGAAAEVFDIANDGSDGSGTLTVYSGGLFSKYTQDYIVTLTGANYTIADTDRIATLVVVTNGADRTITMPAAANNKHRVITIRNGSADGTYYVNITGPGHKLKSIGDFVTYQSNGTDWLLICDYRASKLGLVQYSAGNTYNGVALDVTSADTFTVTRAVFVPYYCAASATWRMKFNGRGANNVARDTLTITIAGVTFDSVADQAISAFGNSSTSGNMGFADNNTDDLKVYNGSASTTIWVFSGDVELESRPTWADDI